MARIASKRLQKELAELNKSCPTGCVMLKADDLETWTIRIEVLGDTIYEDEIFALRFRFDSSYPIEAPEVTFVVGEGWFAPVHPHIYSNGHCCMSILGSGWSPVLNVAAICLTMQSMLASCKEKKLPPDNERYIKKAPKSPKDTRWAYHDDDV